MGAASDQQLCGDSAGGLVAECGLYYGPGPTGGEVNAARAVGCLSAFAAVRLAQGRHRVYGAFGFCQPGGGRSGAVGVVEFVTRWGLGVFANYDE